ncbi:MAG: class B sortase [Eubacteriales bacterium]|nr:class B sortase [Eubacteriales bacterium]
MAQGILKLLNGVVSTFIAIIICILAAYSIYALWDNNQIYAAADDVQADLLQMKPIVEEDGGASFEELLKINKDVCAWVTLDGTKIDYPVLQGENILSYINTDVYGNFALAGSIFLDNDNDPGFHDSYSLIYGHHMADHKMFGDLDLYEEEKFFNEDTTGSLILPDRSYKLEIFATLLISSSENAIFDPEQWFTDIEGLMTFTETNALLMHQDTMEALRNDENPQIVAFSTCSNDFTDARTVVLARMIPVSR